MSIEKLSFRDRKKETVDHLIYLVMRYKDAKINNSDQQDFWVYKLFRASVENLPIDFHCADQQEKMFVDAIDKVIKLLDP